ncbi:Serine protease SPPA, chloroplastic [Capsicum baccatum]|uniref:Serine protease SPPA, chloroplastic n=1 Tax=Capsicum baccatum TaxID=33114 RepID=A0A2G2WR63_CAPBA|nr:Serine protease SPPA, chloroplastic [Capsicum baccatum]
MEVLKEEQGIILSQRKYTLDLLNEFDVSHLPPASSPMDPSVKLPAESTNLMSDPSLYRHLIGKLNYLTHTRPDLCFAVLTLRQYLQQPSLDHYQAGLRVISYLRTYPNQGIFLNASSSFSLHTYCDAYWASCRTTRQSVSGFFISLGKFIVGYSPACGEKEYCIGCACQELYAPPSAYFELYGLEVQASFLGGVFEKVGIEPQVQRIGKYKSAGDQLTRKSISGEHREMLTALLDNIYGNWLEQVALTKGKKKEDIEQFVNDGVYQVERLKEESWMTDIKYDDEHVVKGTLPKSPKLGLGMMKAWDIASFYERRYSKVRRWTLGLAGYEDQIAVIRASGIISRTCGPFSSSSSGIIAETLIEKIPNVQGLIILSFARYNSIGVSIPFLKHAFTNISVPLRMWREIRLLAESKPVIASMADVAASGGYYMAMAAQAIVAENLTLTGSIGVVTGKFNLGNLYEKNGFNKETISRGSCAELTAAEQRPFRPEEAELFAKSAWHAYTQFRDKAALSRSMTVDKIDEVAQGRVWTGKDALSRGLVDAVGGLSRAVAIAKQKANIPQERQDLNLLIFKERASEFSCQNQSFRVVGKERQKMRERIWARNIMELPSSTAVVSSNSPSSVVLSLDGSFSTTRPAETEQELDERKLVVEAAGTDFDWSALFMAFCLTSGVEITLYALQAGNDSRSPDHDHDSLPLCFQLLSFSILLAFASLLVGRFIKCNYPDESQVLERAGILLATTAYYLAMTMPFSLFLKGCSWGIYLFSLLAIAICNRS